MDSFAEGKASEGRALRSHRRGEEAFLKVRSVVFVAGISVFLVIHIVWWSVKRYWSLDMSQLEVVKHCSSKVFVSWFEAVARRKPSNKSTRNIRPQPLQLRLKLTTHQKQGPWPDEAPQSLPTSRKRQKGHGERLATSLVCCHDLLRRVLFGGQWEFSELWRLGLRPLRFWLFLSSLSTPRKMVILLQYESVYSSWSLWIDCHQYWFKDKNTTLPRFFCFTNAVLLAT